MEHPTHKINIIGDTLITTTTGSVGAAQRFGQTMGALYSNKFLSKTNSHLDAGCAISQQMTNDFQSTRCPSGSLGALVAFIHNNKPQLFEFDSANFQPESKENIWFASMGSGQILADPVLYMLKKAFCPNNPPSIPEGIFITTWVLSHVCEINPGGIKEPWHIAIIKRNPDARGRWHAKELSEDELNEHYSSVEEAYSHLSSFRSVLQGDNNTPDLPTPPEKQ